MNQPNKKNKTVFIIPTLREISEDATYILSKIHSGAVTGQKSVTSGFKKMIPFRGTKPSKGGGIYRDVCGSGFTNENCMADYDVGSGYKVKREDYTQQSKNGTNSNVNKHLLDSEINFEVVQDPKLLTIDDHNNNWKVLFDMLYKQTDIYYKQNEDQRPKEGEGKRIIYVAGHQHNFQKKLFKFDKPKNPKKKYGFYNGSVVKVCDENGLQVKMAYVPVYKGETKDKYQYIEKDTDMKKKDEHDKSVLKEGSMKSIENHILLRYFDVYFIRHGTALHNNKKVKDNIEQKYLLNSPLLEVGREQALEIKEKFTDKLPGKERIILFSSPLDRAVETGILSAYGREHKDLHDKFDKMLKSTIDKSGANKYMESNGGSKTKKSNYKSRTKKLRKRQTRKRIKLNRRRKTKRNRN